MKITGYIFIILNLFAFILNDCLYKINPSKEEDCTAITLSDFDKTFVKDYGMEADTCCLMVASEKGVPDQKICFPTQKSKVVDFEDNYKKIAKEEGDDMSNVKISIECSSSYIKYGLSILMILL